MTSKSYSEGLVIAPPCDTSRDKIMTATSPSTSRIQGTIERDERQPLLGDDLEAKTTITPLPIRQLSVLCMLRVLDPLAFSQIFPYINNFMEDLHLTDDPSQVGFYSGLVVCMWRDGYVQVDPHLM